MMDAERLMCPEDGGSMRIALLGNMNNGNFAMLRYFRDLGVQADLLQFADDGVGPLAHFSPECDTWSMEKWAPYIKRINAPNRFVSIIGNDFPWNLLFWGKYLLSMRNRTWSNKFSRPIDLEHIRSELAGYDRIVGSGVAPALMNSAGIALDVYYPYSSGVEWVGDPDVLTEMKSPSLLKRMGAERVRKNQIEGIQRAKRVVSSDVGYTEKVFEGMGVAPTNLPLPMVYRESPPAELPKHVSKIIDGISGYEFKLISHARHRWVNSGDHDEEAWESRYSKHNNWIISAYAKFKKQHPSLRSILILSEYGTDVPYSKSLCRDMGVDSDVMWIPKMPKMEIMEIISACDVGIGEFYSMPKMTWGGTALEIMVCGKPLIQGFIFALGEYEAIYGHPPPPLCATDSEEALFNWIKLLATDVVLRKELGSKCLDWFNSYSGIGLARQWLKMIAA